MTSFQSAGLIVLTIVAVAGAACQRQDAEGPPSQAQESGTSQVRRASTSEPELPAPAIEPTVAPEVATEPVAASEALEVSGDVTRPVRLSGETVDLFESGCPSTTPRSRLRRFPRLIIKTVIDRDGRVTSVEFLKHGPDECLKEYVKARLSAWRFKPATLDGRPVAVNYYLTIHIHIR